VHLALNKVNPNIFLYKKNMHRRVLMRQKCDVCLSFLFLSTD